MNNPINHGFADRFLREPSYFPTDDAPTWGDSHIDLQLPATPVRVSGLTQEQRDWLAERFAPRVANSSDPALVRLRRLPASWFWGKERMGLYYDLDIQRDKQGAQIAGLGFVAQINNTHSPAITIWTHTDRSAEFVGVVENVLRIFTAMRVVDHGGVMLHSAGIQLADGAHLFWGHSGAGKSTLSRLAQTAGYPVISDDLNVILPTRDGYQVEPVPFAGDLGQTAEVREPLALRGLHRLEKAPSHSRATLSAARALAGMVSCAPFVNTDPHREVRLWDQLQRLLQEIPTDMVYFAKTPDIWTILANTSSQSG